MVFLSLVGNTAYLGTYFARPLFSPSPREVTLFRIPPVTSSVAMTDTGAHLISIDLIDDISEDESGAVPKFHITGGNLVHGNDQQKHQLDADVGDEALSVKCDLVQVLHGTSVENGTPATIAVFQFAFVPWGNNRRFREVKINVTFSDGEIERISPMGSFAIARSQTTQELSHAVSPSLQMAVAPISASLGYQWQKKETKTLDGFTRLDGRVKAFGVHGSRKRLNTAAWRLNENHQTESGIPTLLQTAVLLKRNAGNAGSPGAKFSAELEIKGKVDRLTQFEDRWKHCIKSITGNKHTGGQIMFDPNVVIQGEVNDLKNLGSEDLDQYTQLVTVKDWEDGKLVKVEPNAAQNSLVGQTEVGTVSLSRVEELGGSSKEDLRGSPGNFPWAESVPRSHFQSAVVPDQNTGCHRDEGLDIGAEVCLPISQVFPFSADSRSHQVSQQTEHSDNTKRLHDLRDQLSRVRIEANLVRRLIRLEEDERRIVHEIIQLENV